MRVLKYAVGAGRFDHLMTDRVDLLCVRVQRGQPQLWALVDEGARPQTRTFRTVATGAPIPERISAYVGTFEIEGSTAAGLIFHLFEVHP